MARYWVINTHKDGQCDEMEKLLDHVPEHLKGVEVWCTCPAGEHAFYFIGEGETSQAVLDSLSDELLLGKTRVLEMAAVTM